MKTAALRSALSDRARDGRIHVVNDFGVTEAPKTKLALAALDALGDYTKRLVVLTRAEPHEWLSMRNLADVRIVAVDQLNTYDVVAHQVVVFSQEAFEEFMRWQLSNLSRRRHPVSGSTMGASNSSQSTRGESSTNSQGRPIGRGTTDHQAVPQEELVVATNSGEYSEKGTTGYIQRLVDGEYVHSEQQRTGAKSVMWSSDLPWPAFLRTARRLLDIEPSAPALWWLSDSDEPAQGLFDKLQKMPEGDASQVTFCRISARHFSIVWRQPFQKLEWTEHEHAEVALMSRSGEALDRDTVTSLMRQTASAALKSALESSGSDLEPVLRVAS